MKFNLSTNIFAKALKTVSKAVAAKSTLPALEGVLIEALDNKVIFTGYNLEIAIKTVVDEVNVKEEGTAVVPFHMLDAIVNKAAAPEIDFSTSSNNAKVTVKSGKSTHKIVTFSVDEYPELPKFDTMQEIVVDGEVITEAVQHTSYACSTDNSKPIYTGSLFEFEPGVLTVVASDGYRVAIKRVEIANKDVTTSVVIPRKAQNEVVRLLSDDEVKILIGQRHLAFKSENVTIFTRILEGSFMNYKAVIPNKDGITTTITLDKSTLYGAVDRLSLYFRDKVKHATIIDIDSEINLSLESITGSGKETITALESTIVGDAVKIGFNNQFLVDAVKTFEDGKLKINFSGSVKPIVICPEDNEATEMQLIVPMRLPDSK